MFYRRVLRDVIPYDPSLKALKFIKKKFVDGSLSASEAAQMFLVSLQVVDTDKLTDLLVAKASLSHNLCCFLFVILKLLYSLRFLL